MSFYGGETEQLRQCSAATMVAANRLTAQLWLLSGRVHSVDWEGPDADQFRAEWLRRAHNAGMDLAQRLRQAAEELAEEAIEQDIASS